MMNFNFNHPLFPKLICVFLMILFMSSIGIALWPLFLKSPSSSQKRFVSNKKPPDLLKNLTIELFGHYTIIREKDVQQSSLNIHLLGIVYSSFGMNSQVLVRTSNGDIRNYIEGDSLSEGVIIKQIKQHSIVILHNGTLETVSLPEKKLRMSPAPTKPIGF